MAEYRFGEFRLDVEERLLRRGSERVELKGRYLDALALMVREAGRLISKDRFHSEVWNGVPVTDEALTQCIRSLRRLLDDKAERPRFIETVPKHGYRFMAPVEAMEGEAERPLPTEGFGSDLPWLFGAGVIGAGLAGFVGGLLYGLVASSGPAGQNSMGAVSVLLVLLCVTILTALLGGTGVSAGLALAERVGGRRTPWLIAGGAVGGALVGTITKMLGVDAFNLLLGRAPTDVAGGVEGLILGAGVGAAALAANRKGRGSLAPAVLTGLAGGAAAGCSIVVLGRPLMAGSLDSLAQAMPGSRLRLDALGTLFGEDGFEAISRSVLTVAEAAMFGGGIVGAMALARRQRGWS